MLCHCDGNSLTGVRENQSHLHAGTGLDLAHPDGSLVMAVRLVGAVWMRPGESQMAVSPPNPCLSPGRQCELS
jgi:hypothetical protein